MGDLQVQPLPRGFAVILVTGADEVAAVRRRIAERQAEREREPSRKAKRRKRDALGRSNARPGRRGGAA